jgi:hypothetical protein
MNDETSGISHPCMSETVLPHPTPPLFYVGAKLGLSRVVEYGLRVWENRMLRKMFEPEEDDVAEY